MPSASRQLARVAALAASGLLLIGVAAGCSTTQEKAEHQQALAAHILKAQAERQKQKREHKDKHGKSGKSSDGSQK